MVKPNELLVTVSSTRYRAYTSVLSTWSSITALRGDLILGKVSYLYAFSTYPDQTSLRSCAIADNCITRGLFTLVLSY